MAFNIDTTIKNMLGAAKNEIKAGWTEVKETAESFFDKRKKRLKKLADKRLLGEIDDEEFKSFLEDEEMLFKDELLAFAVISKAVAQKAANAALDVLFNTIKGLLPVPGK